MGEWEGGGLEHDFERQAREPWRRGEESNQIYADFETI